MNDARLNANPLVDEAHHRVSAAGFKYLATELLCSATGGPQKYTGRSMKDSHAHLKIAARSPNAGFAADSSSALPLPRGSG
jgi:hemoglobin